jgi:hypothetical protein
MTKANKIENIRTRLNNLKVGYTTTMWGLLVWKLSEHYFAVGETISVSSNLVGTQEAIERLMNA